MNRVCYACGENCSEKRCPRCGFEPDLILGDQHAGEQKNRENAAAWRKNILSNICVDVILKQYDGSRFVDKAYRIADKGRLTSGQECRLNGDFGACAAADWQLVVNDNGDAYKVSVKMPAMTESEFVHISLKPVPDTLQATLIIRNNSRQAESSPFFLRRKAR